MTWLNLPCWRPIAPRVSRAAVAVLALVLIAACAPVRPRPGDAALEAAQRAREQALALQPDWALSGRIAVSADGQGGSGRIEWRQRGSDFDIRLIAPITGQGWRLTRQGRRVRLEGLPAGVLEGADAEQLLEEATGWRLPVDALAAWVRAGRAPGLADIGFGPDGLPMTLRQAGWTVEYRAWGAQTPPLPGKVFAEQGSARVRLAIDRWEAP